METLTDRWTTLGLLALAGAAGTLARHGLVSVVGRFHPSGSRLGLLATLSVNVLGCAAFGMCWALCTGRGEAWTPARLIVLTGFLGAFTTFSTYGFEVLTLLREGRLAGAAGLMVAHHGLGIAAAAAGMWAGSRVVGA